MSDLSKELVDVHIRAMSLHAYRTSSAHHDELFREFALVMALPAAAGHELPAQLLGLIERLNERFSRFTASPEAELQAAIERDDETIDLTFQVPHGARDACLELVDLLERADEYCRHGDLLTIAPPPEAVRFRRWYLQEFIDQINGKPPVPWPQFLRDSTPA